MQEDYALLYSRMHERNKTYPGYSIKYPAYTKVIADLVKRTEATSLLDFGCGKGYQYLDLRVHERWGGILPYCYDIGVRQLCRKPDRKFDGVISTDVMEHIAEPDIDAVMEEIVGYANKFVFLGIAIVPSKEKVFPDGRNVHLTVQSPKWWDRKLAPYRERILLEVKYRGT